MVCFIKKYLKLIIICILIIFIAVYLVPKIIDCSYFYYTGKPNTTFASSDILNFWGIIIGAIISALITITVFILTMRHNRRVQENKRREELMPFLTFNMITKRIRENSVVLNINYLSLRNIGLNSAVELQSNKYFSIWFTGCW